MKALILSEVIKCLGSLGILRATSAEVKWRIGIGSYRGFIKVQNVVLN